MEVHFGAEKKTIAVEELIGKVPELAELHGKLRERYLREPGASAEAAEVRARRSLEGIVRAALADFGKAFVDGKGALLDQILAARQAIHDFYSALMKEGAPPPKIADIRAKFARLKKALADVAEPTEEMAARQKPGEQLAAEQKKLVDELAPTPPHPQAKTPISAGTKRLIDKGFTFVTSIGRWVKNYVTGRVEFEIGPDGLYRVKSFRKGATSPSLEFSEFETLQLPYKDKPLSSSVMQAHHGLQDALMKFLFGETGPNKKHGFGYNGDEVPTMWLRNSTGESPHGRITHEFQNPNEATRMSNPDLSYAKIREYGVADLKAVGAPAGKIADYLAKIDAHFVQNILPNIKRAVDEGRLSPRAARKLVGGDLFTGVVP